MFDRRLSGFSALFRDSQKGGSETRIYDLSASPFTRTGCKAA